MDPPLPSSMSFDQWLSLIHSDDQPSVRALLSDRTLCSCFPVEFRVRVSGTERWLQLHGGIQEDGSQEEGPRLLSVLSDVTCLIEREEKRRASQEEENARILEKANTAEELKRQQQEFVDTICHEIRNPLQGIVGAVQMMRDELGRIEETLRKAPPDGLVNPPAPSFASVYGYLDTITECGRQQRLITDDVLDLSRLAAGVAEVALEQFPLRRLFSALRVMFAPVAELRHFTLTMRVPNVSLCSDYGRLSQILVRTS